MTGTEDGEAAAALTGAAPYPKAMLIATTTARIVAPVASPTCHSFLSRCIQLILSKNKQESCFRHRSLLLGSVQISIVHWLLVVNPCRNGVCIRNDADPI